MLVTSNSETNHYMSGLRTSTGCVINVTKHKAKKFFCKYCIQYFAIVNQYYKNTRIDCIAVEQKVVKLLKCHLRVKLPNSNPSERPVKIPFVIYADLEALLHKLDCF